MDRLRLTSPLWSVAFEMRHARSDDDAVVAFEMAAYDDLVSVAELAALAERALWISRRVQRVRDDGGLHLAGAARHADIGKEAAYRALGLEGVTMMSSDLSDRAPFVQRLREAYGRAERRLVEDPLWLRGLPGWWKLTFTVEQRRALSAYERSRVPRYREAS